VALHRKLTHIEQSLAEITDKINQAIIRQGKKIIFFIDEVERLSKPAMLKLFELIRLSAKFKNTIYILSFDVKIVSRMLEDEGGINFVEKIIQLPVQLPPVEKRFIRNFLYGQINLILKKNGFDTEKREKITVQFSKAYEAKFEAVIKNMRDVKFFLNAFQLTFPAVKEDVNVYDFLIITLIRVFYPAVYDDICTHPEHYIMLERTGGDIAMTTDFAEHKKITGKIKTRHIEELLNSEFKDENTRLLAAALLLEIFPVKCTNKISKACADTRISELQKRICTAKCFAKYFMSRSFHKERNKKAKTVKTPAYR
jgi:predicted KAP-like P-loop ATPase